MRYPPIIIYSFCPNLIIYNEVRKTRTPGPRFHHNRRPNPILSAPLRDFTLIRPLGALLLALCRLRLAAVFPCMKPDFEFPWRGIEVKLRAAYIADFTGPHFAHLGAFEAVHGGDVLFREGGPGLIC